MNERIHAFSIALCPATPGLSETALSRRRSDVLEMVIALIPSAASLIGTCLEERIVAEDGQLWIAFDLVISPQLSLELHASHCKTRRVGISAMAQMYLNLDRMKNEGRYAAIRVGELTRLAARLPMMEIQDVLDTIGTFGAYDLASWKLSHVRGGRRVSLRFNDGTVNVQLPLLSPFLVDRSVRTFRCALERVSNEGAVATNIEIIGGRDEPSGWPVQLPEKLKLRAPLFSCEDQRNEWFLLYVSKFASIPLEMEGRLLFNPSDGRPIQIELLQLINRDILLDALTGLSTSLGATSLNSGLSD